MTQLNEKAQNNCGCPDRGLGDNKSAITAPAKAWKGRRSALLAGVGVLGTMALLRRSWAGGMALVNDSQYDIFSVLAAYSEFGTFEGLVEQAGLAVDARSAVDVTLFAPTNAAFYKHPTYLQTLVPGGSDSFPDTRKLIEFVRNHVVQGMYMPAQLEGKKLNLTSLAGYPVEIDGTGAGAPIVGYHLVEGQTVKAQITAPPIRASNGIVYPIDSAILGL